MYRRAYLGYLSATGSALGWLLHRNPDVYRYIAESIKHYPGQNGVRKMMEEAGFVDRLIEIHSRDGTIEGLSQAGRVELKRLKRFFKEVMHQTLTRLNSCSAMLDSGERKWSSPST